MLSERVTLREKKRNLMELSVASCKKLFGTYCRKMQNGEIKAEKANSSYDTDLARAGRFSDPRASTSLQNSRMGGVQSKTVIALPSKILSVLPETPGNCATSGKNLLLYFSPLFPTPPENKLV